MSPIRLSTYFAIIFLNIGHFIQLFGQNQVSRHLMVCGDQQVVIFDVNSSKDTIPNVIWEWNASKAMDLPAVYRNQYFNHMDDCKPVDKGKKIIVTSSAGGVALIELATKRVLFYAKTGNAHSVELLPNNRLIVAGSTNEKGNRVELFDINQPEKPIFKDSLYSGHGVVWDENLQLLYALGYDELRAYELKDWDSATPSLKKVHSWKIPGKSGHDLVSVPNAITKLVLTEHESVWVFDKVTHQFTPCEPLKGVKDVKAVSYHPTIGQLAYIKAETSWWSNRVYLKGPDQYFSFPDIHLYKTRWIDFPLRQVSAIIDHLKDPQSEEVLIAAHRGDWFWAPENSIAAFRNCIEAGIDILEIDVRLSKDGIPVVIHDLTLERTTTGSGKVADFTLAELKQLYLKDAVEVVTKESIPTLEEVLLLCKNRIIVYLDKSYDKIPQILPLLKQTGTLEQAMFVLDFPYDKAKSVFGADLEKVLFVPVIADGMKDLDTYVDGYLEKLNPVAFQFRMNDYNGGAYHQLNKIVQSERKAFVAATWPQHTIGHDDRMARTNPDDSWGWLVEKGFQILETNRPIDMLSYLRENKKHD